MFNQTNFCKWKNEGSLHIFLDIWQSGQFARIQVNPTKPYVLSIDSITGWCRPLNEEPLDQDKIYSTPPIWQLGDSLNEKNILSLLQQAQVFIREETQKSLCIVLFRESPGFQLWESFFSKNSDLLDAEIKHSTEMEWKTMLQAVAPESHIPFGKELIKKVADNLEKFEVMAYNHREYCGHGLVFRDKKFILATFADGQEYKILQEWNNKTSFIEFFSKLNDFSCSGADKNFPLFFTEDPWEVGNQRITHKRLLEFSK